MTRRIPYIFILISAALAFGLASVFHYTYDWLGQNLFAGLFFPINESVFQHLKLILYPLLIVWFLLYRWIDTPERLNKYQVFTGILISTLITMYVVLSVFYILEGGFGFTSDIVNISSLFAGLLIGQFFSTQYLAKFQAPKWLGILNIVLLLGMGAALAYFTLYPLNVPIMAPPG